MKSIILLLISIFIFVGCAKTSLNSTLDNDNATKEVIEEEVNIEEKLKNLEAECNNGLAYSCSSLADIYYIGKDNVTKDEIKAIGLDEKACNLGYIQSCDKLASIYYLSNNYTKALEFYEKSCNGGSSSSCNDLAEMYKNGDGVAKDTAKFIELKNKSCEKGDISSCVDFGYISATGKDGVARNFKEAFSIFQNGCANGDSMACNNLGLMFYHGEGTKKDIEGALTAYILSCEFGDALGCLNAADILDEHGNDYKSENEYREKACRYSGNLGCAYSGIGRIYQYFPSVNISEKRCDYSDAESCYYMGYFYSEGIGKKERDYHKALHIT